MSNEQKIILFIIVCQLRIMDYVFIPFKEKVTILKINYFSGYLAIVFWAVCQLNREQIYCDIVRNSRCLHPYSSK